MHPLLIHMGSRACVCTHCPFRLMILDAMSQASRIVFAASVIAAEYVTSSSLFCSTEVSVARRFALLRAATLK